MEHGSHFAASTGEFSSGCWRLRSLSRHTQRLGRHGVWYSVTCELMGYATIFLQHPRSGRDICRRRRRRTTGPERGHKCGPRGCAGGPLRTDYRGRAYRRGRDRGHRRRWDHSPYSAVPGCFPLVTSTEVRIQRAPNERHVGGAEGAFPTTELRPPFRRPGRLSRLWRPGRHTLLQPLPEYRTSAHAASAVKRSS
jgi:hypothetical protein